MQYNFSEGIAILAGELVCTCSSLQVLFKHRIFNKRSCNMKYKLLLLCFVAVMLQASAQTTISVMENVIYYDGYAAIVSSPPPPPGVIQHRNDLFARKLTGAELSSIGTTLQMNVVIKALCDNYDRIGNVNMALVPSGLSTYIPDSVQRIELGRFITPFMNKNIQPDTVPYTFNIDNVAMLLRDTGITNNYDLWIELQVFGVPYAAQTQVAGCPGRNDVFIGNLYFVTNTPAPPQNSNVLLPLFFQNDFNNYQVWATDLLGTTVKSITFNLPDALTDASFFLITSNHGANSGGEEYNRRYHYVYLDNALKLTYRPGRTSCEPFRQYNTQANGIYGPTPRTDTEWQSFSNWCPGDVIDIRQINLGSLAAGNHTFLIRVPTAVFTGAQGNFPLSLYLQGKSSGIVSILNENTEKDFLVPVYPNPGRGKFSLDLSMENTEIVITDLLGIQVLKTQTTEKTLNLEIGKSGVYILYVKTGRGISKQKLIVN